MSSSRTQNLIRSRKLNINNCNSLKRLTAIAYTLCQAQLIMERIKNDMEDFVINGKLTIKELYELAKKEGFEDRHLFFSVKNKKTGQYFSTDTVVDFGKGWTKDSAIMHLTWEELPHQDACVG